MNVPYIAPHKNCEGENNPHYDHEMDALENLEDALGSLGDCLVSLHRARKGEVYFEDLEYDIEQIEQELVKIHKRFERLTRGRF